MGNMVDVIFYQNRLALQNLIEGYKNIMNVPNIGERVMVNDKCYKVIDRLFDFDGNTVHIIVELCKTRLARYKEL